MKKKQEDKLLPCPFCGTKAEAIDTNSGYIVSCDTYKCVTMYCDADTKQHAIKFWNKRAKI